MDFGKIEEWSKMISGGDEEGRTPDLCIANAALCQLSYIPTQEGEFCHAGVKNSTIQL